MVSQPSTSSTLDPTPCTTSRAKIITLPFNPQFAMVNRFIHASNYKFIYTARDSIGKAVMNKKGTVHDSSSKESGVYHIPCSIPGCNKPYFGRTMIGLEKRMVQHDTNITQKSNDSALVHHMRSNPGHSFNTSEAKLIWKTRNKYECQFVEAACINQFPSCNISKGEVRVTPAMSAFTTYIAGLHRHLGNNTSPDVRGSTSSSPLPPVAVPPPATTHSRPSHSPPASMPAPDGPVLLPPISGNIVPLPTQNSGNSPPHHVSNGTIHSSAIPHGSLALPNIASSHRSLKRILTQDQSITTSPRRLRSRYTHSSSNQ